MDGFAVLTTWQILPCKLDNFAKIKLHVSKMTTSDVGKMLLLREMIHSTCQVTEILILDSAD
jgi:hypothetical protein